jgi:transcriptional regulator with XRE-family HTH domain
LDEPEAAPTALAEILPINGNGHRRQLNLGESIRTLRLRRSLSQKQLAERMGIARTYISKCETRKVTPTLSSLERLAKALEVSVPELLVDGERSRERNRQEETRELMENHLVREILPYVAKLSKTQMAVVLARVADLKRRRVGVGSFGEDQIWRECLLGSVRPCRQLPKRAFSAAKSPGSRW